MSDIDHIAPNYIAAYRAIARVCNDEKIAATKFIKSLPENEQKRLEGLYKETTFQRRHYGNGQFYCWPLHPVFLSDDRRTNIDPWPATNYPKHVLMTSFAIRTPEPA